MILTLHKKISKVVTIMILANLILILLSLDILGTQKTKATSLPYLPIIVKVDQPYKPTLTIEKIFPNLDILGTQKTKATSLPYLPIIVKVDHRPTLIIKKLGPNEVKAGSVVVYSFTLRHNRSSDALPIPISTTLKLISDNSYVPVTGDNNDNDILEPGETWTYMFSYTIPNDRATTENEKLTRNPVLTMGQVHTTEKVTNIYFSDGGLDFLWSFESEEPFIIRIITPEKVTDISLPHSNTHYHKHLTHTPSYFYNNPSDTIPFILILVRFELLIVLVEVISLFILEIACIKFPLFDKHPFNNHVINLNGFRLVGKGASLRVEPMPKRIFQAAKRNLQKEIDFPYYKLKAKKSFYKFVNLKNNLGDSRLWRKLWLRHLIK